MDEKLKSYIMDLPVGNSAGFFAENVTVDSVNTVDIKNLPNGVVTGSALLEFKDGLPPAVRSSVALSLLAAQRVASLDPATATPDQWISRHNHVLQNLNWAVEKYDVVESEFKSLKMTVHEAIIPFLTAALGPGAAASSLILTALKQLNEMDKDSSWITLLDTQSRRFNISEFHFGVVASEGNQTRLNLAAARFDAKFGRTQILFFKLKKEKAKFDMISSSLLANSDLLEAMNVELVIKMRNLTRSYIQNMNVGG